MIRPNKIYIRYDQHCCQCEDYLHNSAKQWYAGGLPWDPENDKIITTYIDRIFPTG